MGGGTQGNEALQPAIPTQVTFENQLPLENAFKEKPLGGGAFSKQTDIPYREPEWKKELRRQEQSGQVGLPETASWEEIDNRRSEIEQQKAIDHRAKLGLSPKATFHQVRDAELEQLRIQKAREAGLLDTASLEEITKALEDKEDEERKREAISLGLDPSTEWDAIYETRREKERLGLIKQLGLKGDASWDEIGEALNTKTHL